MRQVCVCRPCYAGIAGYGCGVERAYARRTEIIDQARSVRLSSINPFDDEYPPGDDHGETPNARTPRPEKVKTETNGILKKQAHPESATLFVGNLPFDATEETLRDLVESNAALGAEVDVKPPLQGDEKEEGNALGKRQDGGRGGKKSGLRKVRLGAFEDTGRCKGYVFTSTTSITLIICSFAFLDFYSPGEATTALTNRNNYVYDARKITLQFASPEATKRSGGRESSKKISKIGHAGPKRRAAVTAEKTISKELREAEAPRRKPKDEVEEEAGTSLKTERVGDQRGKKWQAAGRPRPGAALAIAKREKVGIVEGRGEKIVFD